MPDLPQVLGIGELLWDRLPDGDQLGGAPANFAYHVAAQGLPAAPVSAVGDDDLGRRALDTLRERDVDTSLIEVVPDRPTGTVDVTLDDDGKPTYTIHEHVAYDALPLTDANRAAAANATAVCYGTLGQRAATAKATIGALLGLTPTDCLRVFDVNLRQSFYDAQTIDNGLRLATAYKLSDEEVPEVAKLLDLPDGHAPFCDALFDRYPALDLLILTAGGDGSTLRKRDGETSEVRRIDANVISTVGAGDSFTAGVVTGLLRGRSLADTHEFAQRLSAFVVTQPGAMPAIPDDLRLA